MDEWSGREKRVVIVQFAVIGILLVTVGMQEGILYDWSEEDDDSITTIAWSVSVQGDNYLIEIIDVASERLDEVSWEVLDSNRLTAEWEDPSGDTLRMKGDMIDVNFSQAAYDGADVQAYDKFYSRDPTRTPPVSNNYTLCIVYMDCNSDGNLNSGDSIWIRPMVNGGCAEEDFRFRMVNEKVGDYYGEKILPRV